MYDRERNMAAVAMPVLIALSVAHFLNDLLQTTVTSAYPIIKDDLDLSFTQIGSITFVYQIAARSRAALSSPPPSPCSASSASPWRPTSQASTWRCSP